MTAPRLVMDARMVGPHPHGIARYVVCLARALKQVAPEWRPTLLVTDDAPASLKEEFTHARAPNAFLEPAEVLGVPAVLSQLGPRLYHATSFSSSPLFTVPYVMTLHDAIHLQRPGDYGWKQLVYYRTVVGPAAQRARAVITVSQDAREQLASHLHVPLARLRVIHNGVEEAYLQAPVHVRDGPILTVTGPKPHKNLATLIHALSHAPKLRLDVVGTPQDGTEELARTLHVEDRIRFLGPLGDEALLEKLTRAVCAAVPSLLEGFGLPALEAMATGCPVVLSDIPVFHEVAGDAARYVDALDAVAWANALTDTVNDANKRSRMAGVGRARAESMTWKACALQTAQCYEDALSAGRPSSFT